MLKIDNALSLVCNAGYYKNGTSCLMCPENIVKATVGNSTSCCDETKMVVPNINQTACGKLFANLEEKDFYKVFNDQAILKVYTQVFVHIFLIIHLECVFGEKYGNLN